MCWTVLMNTILARPSHANSFPSSSQQALTVKPGSWESQVCEPAQKSDCTPDQLFLVGGYSVVDKMAKGTRKKLKKKRPIDVNSKFFEKCSEFLKISIFQWSLGSRWKLFMRWQKVKGYSDIQDYQRFWRILRKSLKNYWNSWRSLSLWYLGSLGVFATVSELQWLMSHGMSWTLDKYLRINLVTVASSIFS